MQLLDGVLKQNPKATACLMGKGYIFLGEGRFTEAREHFYHTPPDTFFGLEFQI
jgi:hypothetical protein